MPDKRMRPIVKQEPGADGAQAAAAAEEEEEREGRRRRGDVASGEEGAGTELEVQLLRANADIIPRKMNQESSAITTFTFATLAAKKQPRPCPTSCPGTTPYSRQLRSP